MKNQKVEIGNDAIYDARELGTPRMLILGLQHLFAMFGATILVPTLTGLSVASTLLFAGIGTLLFHLLTKRKVPAFLGSSFAFLAGYFAIAPDKDPALLPYACFGVAAAGIIYLILSACFKGFGVKKVMQFFPPIVTGPIIISIGLILSPVAINECMDTTHPLSWLYALVAIVVIIVANIWGKRMAKIIPILLGVIVSYLIAAFTGGVDFAQVHEAGWIGIPLHMENTVFGLFGSGKVDTAILISAVITIVPLAIATTVEHIGDMSAISSTCESNFIEDPGLHRTLLGDGLATILASLFGAPANTTYGENTGVLALTKVYDPRVIRIAAGFAILLSFCPKFSALIASMPVGTIGGVSLILYGMISAVGVRNVVENKVDFTKSRNVLVAALILVLSIGIAYSSAGAIVFPVGSASISLSGLAVGSLVGIILNAALPGKDYVFGTDEQGDQSVDFIVQ